MEAIKKLIGKRVIIRSYGAGVFFGTLNEVEQTEDKWTVELQGKKFRIRKLSERECFRLMDVEDADIDKIQATGISRSAQYKLAGNSIVTSVLYHIFDKLFINTDQPKETGLQLSLF